MKRSKKNSTPMCDEVSSTSDAVDTNLSRLVLKIPETNRLRSRPESNDDNQRVQQDSIRQRLRPRDKLKKLDLKVLDDDELNEDYAATEEIDHYHKVTINTLAETENQAFISHIFRTINASTEKKNDDLSNFYMDYEYRDVNRQQPSTSSGLQGSWSTSFEDAQRKPIAVKLSIWKKLEPKRNLEKKDSSVSNTYKTDDATDTKNAFSLENTKITGSLANSESLQIEFVKEENGTNNLPKQENVEKQDLPSFNNNNKITKVNEISDPRLHDLATLNDLIKQTLSCVTNSAQIETKNDPDNEENNLSEEDICESLGLIHDIEKQDSDASE